MLSEVFKAYDVRGVYPDPLNEDLARQIGCAVGTYLRQQVEGRAASDPMLEHIVVGRDMRKSAPSMSDALIEGIQRSGAHVIDLGMVDTSFIYFAINHLGCAGGVMVTASHNPPQYIGFKVSAQHAVPVGKETGLDQIKRIAATVDLSRAAGFEPGRVEQRDLWDAYKQHVTQFLKIDRPLKVIVDASNGMAGKFMPLLFEDAKHLEVIGLNYETTGEFVHDPNPLVADNMTMTQQAVKEHGADLGVCFDGDADRCMFTDENGQLIAADLLGGLLAAKFLEEESPGSAIVYDLRASKALVETIERHGGRPVRSRVGHVFMKHLMKQHDAVFGAELSAHVYYRKNWYADSGAITLAVTLNLLGDQQKPMSELMKPMQKYAASGETNFEVLDKRMAMDQIEQTFADRADIDELDGVTVDAFDTAGWWFNVRPSNTEPLLRLNMEAKDAATLEQMFEQVKAMLGQPVAGH